MSQQYPQHQPGFGAPQQPGWGPPPPPEKSPAGKIIGLGCLGVVALFVVIGIIAALVGGGGDSEDAGTTGAGSSAPAAAQEKDTAPQKDEPPAEEEPEEKSPVAVTAKKTSFAKSILADGGDYTSVLVTITNNGDEQIDVNPLYFTITDTDGTKHTAELAVDENQIDTVTLARGENVSGTVTGKGTFTPKYVTYTDGLLGDSVRTEVS
ncbi:DUF4352 domain-containing protein [Streptomyces aurantiogriseus]|uniref:DUF4352 domain-containing protein n=1 Tax=Streptomyces aurantiogriseus TaxID=66870 RepID=A0A918C640_9ACTN|nr:DUF4352 domain-containing protein [Streptomyces aurantiogriseus]GGR07102.1 hypothetical protein GCM10010251_23710 [Streptomyces aurantiogriseus]